MEVEVRAIFGPIYQSTLFGSMTAIFLEQSRAKLFCANHFVYLPRDPIGVIGSVCLSIAVCGLLFVSLVVCNEG